MLVRLFHAQNDLLGWALILPAEACAFSAAPVPQCAVNSSHPPAHTSPFGK